MKIINHILTIFRHKYYVLKYCIQMGIWWRGITHDLSKFHPIEFFESLKYYEKGSSPIPRCKKDKGYSNAWFHHRGHNDHHYEYWIDNLDGGGTAIKMPYNAMLEMIADWLGAGKAYIKNYSYKDEYDWWMAYKHKMKIHNVTAEFIESIFYHLSIGTFSLRRLGQEKKTFKIIYDESN